MFDQTNPALVGIRDFLLGHILYAHWWWVVSDGCVLPLAVRLHYRFFPIAQQVPQEALSGGCDCQRTRPDWSLNRCSHWTSQLEPPEHTSTQNHITNFENPSFTCCSMKHMSSPSNKFNLFIPHIQIDFDVSRNNHSVVAVIKLWYKKYLNKHAWYIVHWKYTQ